MQSQNNHRKNNWQRTSSCATNFAKFSALGCHHSLLSDSRVLFVSIDRCTAASILKVEMVNAFTTVCCFLDVLEKRKVMITKKICLLEKKRRYFPFIDFEDIMIYLKKWPELYRVEDEDSKIVNQTALFRKF